jgi:NADH-quinone oxidoreductase subunit H
MYQWLSDLQQNYPWILMLIRVLLVLIPILTIVPGLIWWERRLLSWMQDRIGPNRVGPFGLLQPIADGVKLFFKEDITPANVDRSIYFIAPALALFPAFALAGTMPWGPNTGVYGLLTPIADVNIGILYVLAISSLGVYGVVLAGYASNNKYSLLGGLRASAQLISYELAMSVSLAAMVLATGSLRMTEMIRQQEMPLWGAVPYLQNWFILTPFGFIAAVIFLICMVAETNRAPFDLPEAENELIAGYHTEYSSMKFAVFFMGEYAAMFIFSGIFATVFLGGYNFLPVRWEELSAAVPAMSGIFNAMAGMNYWLAPLFFIGKCAFGITCYIWLRATLPRLRYDQLMSLGWKSLLPVAVANFIVVAVWIVGTRFSQEMGYGVVGGWAAAIVSMLLLVVLYIGMRAVTGGDRRLESRRATMIDEDRPRGARLVDPGTPAAGES